MSFVETLNPHFYPVPINRTFNDDPTTGGTISHASGGFLTRDELVEAHGRCGDVLHAENPYRAQNASTSQWRQRFEEWNRKTRLLLRLHTAQLIDQDTQWWVVMKFGTDQPVQVAEMKALAGHSE